MNADAESRRSPWPIAITVLFIVFALYLTGFIVWAVGQKQDLVASDYYEREVRYQEQLIRLNRTRVLGDQVAVRFDPASRSVVVNLPAAQVATAKGRIHFYRPSNARLDQFVPLALDSTGRQSVDARALAAGVWKVRVEWSVDDGEFYFEQPLSVN